jgi:hypothetical protein
MNIGFCDEIIKEFYEYWEYYQAIENKNIGDL